MVQKWIHLEIFLYRRAAARQCAQHLRHVGAHKDEVRGAKSSKSERKTQDARSKTYQNHITNRNGDLGHGESGEIMRNPPPDGISINNGLATSRQLPATSSHASHGQESQLRHTNRELHLRFAHGRQVQVGSQTSREKHKSHAKITGM